MLAERYLAKVVSKDFGTIVHENGFLPLFFLKNILLHRINYYLSRLLVSFFKLPLYWFLLHYIVVRRNLDILLPLL